MGSADTVRDPRGFAVKFYTEEGNWDLVGNNTPIFFIRDPIHVRGSVCLCVCVCVCACARAHVCVSLGHTHSFGADCSLINHSGGSASDC